MVTSRSTLRALWTLVTLASSFPILGIVLGGAAWNGVNFVVGFYLFISIGGFVGLFAGFGAAFSHKRLLAWITCVSAVAIGILSAFFACSFVLTRESDVPLNSPLLIGGFQIPILSLYAAAVICCSIEALLYFPKPKKLRT